MTDYCEVCAGELDQDILRAGPLKKVCLECLSTEQRDALQHDLEVAGQIQARLLPARNFTFGRWQIHYHYEPLGTVSGDHIDLIRPDRTGRALHFLFGDVSGKGVAASILMANLQALFPSLVSQELPLVEIVERANRLFHESTAPNSYATLVAGRLNGSGAVEICNAGHNPPLRVGEDSVHPIAAGGPPLGISSATRYEPRSLEFSPEDYLFLYTDGLSEANNASGEEYGACRLEECLIDYRGLPARDVVDKVLAEVQKFQNGTPQIDDVTAMAIRLRP
jgi:sigma-B regulation protein RsbU (phosphoserine phosphatase)